MYEENAPYSNTIRALFLGAILLLAAATALSLAGIYETPDTSPILLAVTAILVLAYWSFFNMRFRITSKGVEAIMPPFTYRVPFEEIKKVRVIEKIPWYVGWGLRIWRRRLAYVSMHKSALEIEKKNGVFRALVLTTRDPEKFVEMLKPHLTVTTENLD
jgi:hypothetical protein